MVCFVGEVGCERENYIASICKLVFPTSVGEGAAIKYAAPVLRLLHRTVCMVLRFFSVRGNHQNDVTGEGTGRRHIG